MRIVTQKKNRRYLLRFRILPVLVLGGMLAAGVVSAEESVKEKLARLFRPPIPREIAEIRAEWAQRDDSVKGWRVEVDKTLANGSRVWIVSCVVNGYRNYGAVRFPSKFRPGGSFPVMIFSHSGFSASLGALKIFTGGEKSGGSKCIADRFFIIYPAFQGEVLNTPSFGQFKSEGSPSVFDWDVDDAIALLNGLLKAVPEADGERVVAYGSSRGGAVTYLLGVREPRIKAAVALFGPTDFFTPRVKKGIEKKVAKVERGEKISLANRFTFEIVRNYLSGKTGLEETRKEFIRRSVVYFADDLPPLQVHHGVRDSTVGIDQGDRLNAVMKEKGIGPPRFEYYRYPEGFHNPKSLHGFLRRAEKFLCEAVKP
ncbi:MAG TPA: hypothetical protein ENL08_04805 [Bacteroidetes bacterium]|nr:hypothetical protein [Bacteroidota bacterium]